MNSTKLRKQIKILKKHPEIKDVRLSLLRKNIYIYTNMLTGTVGEKERPLGMFRICLSRKTFRPIGNRPIKNLTLACNKNDHPAISMGGSCCFGGAGDAIEFYIAEKNLNFVVDSIICWLQTPTDSGYCRPWEFWFRNSKLKWNSGLKTLIK